ncbi:MAG: hypothetical protein WDN00_11660 [Limisphaerales bacterium]
MRCFYHQEKESVGICKSCGKGVCQECAVDLKRGLACRGHCEDNVQSIILQITERDKHLEQHRKQSEEYLKDTAEHKASLEQYKKDLSTWEKAMEDYENRKKFRNPPNS